METGTPAGGSGAAPDPNFPQGLWIQPSSSKHRQARASTTRDLAASAAATRWDEDSQHDIDQYGIAGRIWEAAYLMAVYLRPPLHSALLGSGAGFGGLHFAQQLCHHRISSKGDRTNSPEEATAYPDTVILTDLPNVVPLMERNAAAAGLLQSTTSPDDELSLATSTQARRPAHPLTHVLCSDLVYFPELLPPLLRSLIDLTDPATGGNGGITTPTSSPEVIISYKIRSLVKEQPFWSAFGSWFDYQPT
ncbi:uncharacterized protein PFL1_05908 [Pseudozyma flocculosa PF-1]|uniref:Uncharacterized protein n=2 Tax=Pseudozyma flocculosa TaxID=84751 RepID=A0A5C3F4T3_9BASI|nr:uncharacterized protein PFL1_05908 [Pseudozyma flocculosa PF-1]EPQ26587.1 hypothetical protein PFL1_05908 [Pseudozyma flocculosa PF-1]SPO38419.1 uncharacterized protein PSFLO_03897 [Pseudozyma flocculosa]